VDTQSIIAALEAERERLTQAINALQGNPRGPGRPRTTSTAPNGRSGRRRMSAAARKRIAESARKRWAKAKAAGRNTL
jgi:hypothetical protein